MDGDKERQDEETFRRMGLVTPMFAEPRELYTQFYNTKFIQLNFIYIASRTLMYVYIGPIGLTNAAAANAGVCSFRRVVSRFLFGKIEKAQNRPTPGELRLGNESV